jgi:hypothetical protein
VALKRKIQTNAPIVIGRPLSKVQASSQTTPAFDTPPGKFTSLTDAAEAWNATSEETTKLHFLGPASLRKCSNF